MVTMIDFKLLLSRSPEAEEPLAAFAQRLSRVRYRPCAGRCCVERMNAKYRT